MAVLATISVEAALTLPATPPRAQCIKDSATSSSEHGKCKVHRGIHVVDPPDNATRPKQQMPKSLTT